MSSLGATVLWSIGLPALAGAAGSSRPMPVRTSIKLASAVRSIGNEQCIAAAARLEALPEESKISLHLRNAGLNYPNAQTIAAALRSLSDHEASAIISVSFSFNSGLGDDGVAILSSALPTALPELGLVGCGIGDRGGEALLQWAKTATRLSMMCIEGNNFSEDLQARFNEMARANPKMLLVI